MRLESKFNLFDRVTIDDDTSIIATVTGFAFYGYQIQAEISWVHNGEVKTSWIIEQRLHLADVGKWPGK